MASVELVTIGQRKGLGLAGGTDPRYVLDVAVDETGDRRVTVVPLTLRAGESVDLTVTMRTGDGQTGDPVLTSTPGIRAEPNDVRVRSACG